ncbi:hypothetical protein SAMN05660976_02154 [Nonomuraea pusilla]|uniref:DUF2567 domain-containing protein n=1 Tax=Nonomuraea pusilla TaxID=46177 RepID=A0A1H7NT41_9ACTN|nr:hypothetical protein SAMN05660976_02154 [Nonomuraea pusilla]
MAREVRAFAVTVLILAVLAVPAGLLWSYLSPRAPYQVGGRGTMLADPTTQALIAADGWYAVITGGLGLACGAVAWAVGRKAMLPVLVGLCGGGVLAAFLTLWLGSTVTIGAVTVEAAASPGTTVVPGALRLTASGVLVCWPLLAVGLFGLLEGMHGYRESPLRHPLGAAPDSQPLQGQSPAPGDRDEGPPATR